MSSLAAPAPAATPAAERREDGLWSVYRVELHKLLAQLPLRVLMLVAVLAPVAFAAVLKVQSGTPADALFGVYVHSTGFAISLVVLGFAGSWGFPIIAGVLAGDLFASEDRHGTWKTILTRSCNREETFSGKVLAAATVAVVLGVLLAAASLVAGLILVGGQRLVDLSGLQMSGGRALVLTSLAWIICLLPLLAYVSVAILASVWSRNGIIGVLSPLLVALAGQLLDLIGKGVVVHMLLIGSAFDGWHGLFTTQPFFGPLLISALVCVIWIVACLGISWRMLRRRDFTGTGTGRTVGWISALRGIAVAIVVVVVLALASNLGPTGVTAYRVSAAIGPEFSSLSLYQQSLLGRNAPAGASLDVLPNCNRRAAKAVGPGDWNCNLYVYLPQPKSVPFQQTLVEYDVSVEYNGCFKAQSPPSFIGGPTMRAADGSSVANPLYIVYGCFNVL